MAITSPYFFGDTGFYGYEINSSMRFSKDNTAYLSRTPSSAGNRRTFTISLWTKKMGNAPSGAEFVISAHDNSTNDSSAYFGINFGTGDTMSVVAYANYRVTTPVFRDNSSWYHIVLAVDSTQGSASNRMKLYVNGSQITALSTDATVAENHDFGWNNTIQHRIGAFNLSANQSYYDGYIAEVHNVDGSQLTPSSFGETKEGVWIPKAYTGSYGTNGFYLKFNQTGSGTASSSTMGADSSGNDNHFTQSNINPIDSNLPDTPTNNFCTLNELRNYGGGTLQIGNTKFVSGSSEYGPATGTFAVSSGKWYAELDQNSATSTFAFGAVETETKLSTGFGLGNATSFTYRQDGNKGIDGTFTSYGATWSQNDIIGMAMNLDDNEVTFYKNNSSQGTFSFTAGEYSIACADDTSSALGAVNLNFGADSSFNNRRTKANNSDENGRGDFFYSPPSGYLALCSANLSEPTISPLDGEQPSDHFNTVLYTGNATDDTAIAVPFQPDFVWIKKRSDAQEHVLFDAVRGATKRIFSNLTNVESDEATSLKAFTSTGFTLGNHSSVNDNTETFASWNWLGANGTASNSDGDLDSTVSVNATAGFSIVSYNSGSSASSNQTVGHGLGVVPKMIIAKSRFASGAWNVYHADVGNDKRLRLDTTAAEATSAVFGDTTPTSSVFTQRITTTNDKDIIAYCFAEVEGYSRISKYVGTGSADGPFVYTGFRPAWVLVKRTDSAKDWLLLDNKRDVDNVAQARLFPNLSDAESTTQSPMDILSNGFKLRVSDTNYNENTGTYIYLAFAEMPFKYANAR